MPSFSFDSNSIAIIDHGYANIGSLSNALSTLGFSACPIKNLNDLSNFENFKGFILPGVGSFGAGMRSLKEHALDTAIFELIDKKIPGMGICLGMQMLAEKSEEDVYQEKGLGIFKGVIKKLDSRNGNVPHIAWSSTTQENINSDMPFINFINGIFYYIHSYVIVPDDHKDVVATFQHGSRKVNAAVYKDGMLGIQFHPEKSQQDGLSLLKAYFSPNKFN